MNVRALALALALSAVGAATAWAQGARPSVADLPLTEVSTTGRSHVFVVFLSGDGGWVALDQGVSAELSARGIPVIGLNSRVYLWSGKTPAETARDLARLITVYRTKWGRDSVVVVGYSRGAGIAPFAVNRLPAALRGTVKAVVLIGAEHGAGFHFRMRDLLRSGPGPDDVPVMPEIRALGATPLICFYGEDEPDTICPGLALPHVVVKMSGGHHLDGQYGEIGKQILALIAR
ncbi:MAG: cutinase family protein [Gemmatimonadetes bacterium]|nr:cutinase family protein [Gemmatimonadota bacterium]